MIAKSMAGFLFGWIPICETAYRPANSASTCATSSSPS